MESINNTINKPVVTIDPVEDEYISQLTPLQHQAYLIANEHLKTSFDISRSNGFTEWLKNRATLNAK
jgi:hypothetical protein